MGDYHLRDLMNAARRVKAADKHFGKQVLKCSDEELVEVLGKHFPDLLDLAREVRRTALERTYTSGS